MASTENLGDTVDLIVLTPAAETAVRSSAGAPQVGLIAGRRQSLSSATTSLLLTRLRAVTMLLLIVYGMVFVWTLLNEGAAFLDTIHIVRNVTMFRLVGLAALLAVLYSRQSFTEYFLRGAEYTLFGVLTLLWIGVRYQSIGQQAAAGNVAELLVGGREAMVGLFMLMIVHGLLIPHRWQGTARVVLTMALAPLLVLVLFEAWNPERVQQVSEILTFRDVSMNLLIVLVGAVLAIYGSHVLNGLRAEVHQAKQFGQYQLVRKLGSGGMGEVHLAEHVLMKRPCALKLIRPELSANPLSLARFEREVKSTAGLTHPHTIEIYDYGHTDDGTFYYVMEYLPGLSLDELLAAAGPLPPGRAIYLLRQACGALAEAHAAGLVHRDLKPGNIYVSERGGQCDFVKILDFGLVKQTRDPEAAQLTADLVVSGTPLYMAPEQAAADRGLDGRCDLYALGAIAYHMLAGRPPFSGESPIKVILAHARDRVPPLESHGVEVPADLEQIVLRCLAKTPEERFADAIELERALAACVAAAEWDAQRAAAWWREACAERETAGIAVK